MNKVWQRRLKEGDYFIWESCGVKGVGCKIGGCFVNPVTQFEIPCNAKIVRKISREKYYFFVNLIEVRRSLEKSLGMAKETIMSAYNDMMRSLENE